MPKIKANNITMNCEGQRAGDPLILIPFLTADNACYAFQVAEYSKLLTCISLDLRGTGERDKPAGDYSTEVLSDDVAAFMRALGIRKGAHLWSIARSSDRDVAGGKTARHSRVPVPAQRMVEDRSVPENSNRGLSGDG